MESLARPIISLRYQHYLTLIIFLLVKTRVEKRTGKMTQSRLTFFILALLLLTRSEGRLLISSTTATSSTEESSINDDECTGAGSEECLMRRSMVDHTDYIYTQDISQP
ncbi:phytosulfokines 3-like [Mangifera indica]|uniref:phytosulfokines 3-like n=1 Tax=Mangifera indica TaxID=29780 RepID=UPI001CF9C07F|nr:phytosulfokines 3-like [Mangifera indica]